MRKISSIVAAVAVIVACSSIALATNNPGTEVGPKEPKVATYPITALGGSGQHGTVTLKNVGANQTQVTITITGEPLPAQEPAHIHTGACPTPGAVKWPLNNVVHGSSITTINAAFSEVNQGGFAVNIHQSPTNIASYKACGNIIGS
jgi:hypothetical protein